RRNTVRGRSPAPPYQDASRRVSGALALNLRPLPQQIVVDARKLHGYRTCRRVQVHTLRRVIQVKEQGTLLIAPHHALNPEKRTNAPASRNRLNPVQARRGI